MRYLITLRSASGRERVVTVWANTDQGACNKALKDATDGEMVCRVKRAG